MEKQIRQILFQKEYSRLKYVTPVLVIITFLAGVLGTLIFNTKSLHSTLQKNTRNFANDVTTQMALNIYSRMQMRQGYVKNLADTFSRIPQSLLTKELLDSKRYHLDMADIFILNPDGTTIPADKDIACIKQYLAENPELFTEARIFVTADNTCDDVFFAAPIVYENTDNSLLIGTRSRALLQQMLQNVAFKDQVSCSIINKDGVIITPSADDRYMQELKTFFDGHIEGDDAVEAQRMLADIENHRSGVSYYENVYGSSIILGYDFLGINEWMLITTVPANLLSDNTAQYFSRYIEIICLLIFIVLLIFFLVPWYYNRALNHTRSIAFTDPITGSNNDLAFRIKAKKLLSDNPLRKYAVVYLNIRNFKLFNERFGVKSGDDLLRQICLVLNRNLRDGEILGRSAGDHFYILMECSDESSVLQRLHIMLEDLKRQQLDKFSLKKIKFDKGACLIQDRNTDFLILTDRAKIASSYQQTNKKCRFYDSALESQLEREHNLDNDFYRAIENHEFKLYIQPKVCPKTHTVKGGEVLVRWQHPELGLLFPGDFIPLFERNGKICDLDFYMFEESCKLMSKWLQEDKKIILSVNLSRAHLLSGNLSFIDKFKEIKETYHIPDNQIELELTESMSLSRHNIYMVKAMINRIRSVGLLCSIDDFGFGYSSLTILKDLNVNTVKLDRQFFIDESKKSWMVVAHLIQLIHKLEMTVVGEGIEDHSQVEKLRIAGCNLIQGYVYAKPLTVYDFERWNITQQ